MKFVIYNKLENTVILETNDYKVFIHKVRAIAVENDDEELSILSISEAIEYLDNYCDNLKLILN